VERIALITGSSSGIGKAITQKFLCDGYTVIGLARDHSKFSPDCNQYHPLSVDLSNVIALEKTIPRIIKKYQNINVFISNAGFGDFRNLENFSALQIRTYFSVNLIAQILISRYMVSHMKKNSFGDVIIIGSEAAIVGKKKATLYSAAKFGLRGFAQSLRDEVGASGLRVCIINPGLVRSPFFDGLNFEPARGEDNAIMPDDIAKLVLETVNTRNGTVVDEINLSPATNNISFKASDR